MNVIMLLTLVIGLSGVVWCLLLVVVEIVTWSSIREPKRRSFSRIQFEARQSQTVIAPALGALYSGLFISLSASFIFKGLTPDGGADESSHLWNPFIGVVLFFAGAVTLLFILWVFFKDRSDSISLAQDPFSIRAAAEEYISAPEQASLKPEDLDTQLKNWVQRKAAYTMGVAPGRPREKNTRGEDQRVRRTTALEAALTKSENSQGRRQGIVNSLRIYYRAARRYRLRFIWPAGVSAILLVGVVWMALDQPEVLISSSGWGSPWLMVIIVAVVEMVVVLAYAVFRGNRARLWYRVYRSAQTGAEHQIRAAHEVKISQVSEEQRLRELVDQLENILEKTRTESAPIDGARAREIIRLGRFRLVKD
ncbi:hypothetical protein D9V32_11490 [Mycetocola tolaasinivorans]|uniref:Uncharacterized protein n=1 Tax=Mycetocola tolaasinivorans TaxID=76635 RepID=A0A3L7A3X6_9MICO|nr:hypothetical protein [Mycetocola tolaasinivorans]RLP75036.1 hypothetical protein D9V32_11490 [Mycetocola tolaasinivorans]